VDYASLKKLVRFQLEGGIHGFVVAGSTAEAATLNLDEKKKLLDFVIGEVAGQVPVVMGSGTFNTQETCDLVRIFEKQKPSGFLIVTPYYNRPPQRGLVAHYKRVAQATLMPILIYNVPSRTACSISPASVSEVAKTCKNVVGIKEAAGNLNTIQELKTLCPPDFLVLSGDDETYIQSVELGGHGVISVISHVIPRWCVDAYRKARGHSETADMVQKAKDMAAALFCESNPIPVKWALKEMGIITSDELRLPLLELAPEFQPRVRATLKSWRLLP
jgi:4-hydroxy-tetrahydrodipicolinate synthase